MKERPILFSAPMVRALLAGTKTQTRRILKPQPPENFCHGDVAAITNGERWAFSNTGFAGGKCGAWPKDPEPGFNCPYGVPGDRLWVKETFRVNGTMAGPRIKYKADDAELWPEGCPDDCEDWLVDDNHWRPSIFMRRYASRITLELTAVRVERLNDISEADALSEGCERRMRADGSEWGAELVEARDNYRTLWGSINGPGSWALNPWVWVLEFRKL